MQKAFVSRNEVVAWLVDRAQRGRGERYQLQRMGWERDAHGRVKKDDEGNLIGRYCVRLTGSGYWGSRAFGLPAGVGAELEGTWPKSRYGQFLSSRSPKRLLQDLGAWDDQTKAMMKAVAERDEAILDRNRANWRAEKVESFLKHDWLSDGARAALEAERANLLATVDAAEAKLDPEERLVREEEK
jgi:hypothetical protein